MYFLPIERIGFPINRENIPTLLIHRNIQMKHSLCKPLNHVRLSLSEKLKFPLIIMGIIITRALEE